MLKHGGDEIYFYMLLKCLVCLSGDSIRITSNTCGEKYDMDNYKKINVTHSGSDVLYKNPCSVEFTKTSYKQFLCVRAEMINLECDTSLEYQRGFVKNYLDPEVLLSDYKK